MFKVILRHYRRMAAFSVGMALLCTSLLVSLGSALSDLAHFAFFLLTIISFLMMALGLYAVKPSQRGILEIAGISGVLSTIFLFYLPYSGVFPTLIGLAVFFGIMTSLWFFLNSSISRKIGRKTMWRDRHSCQIPYPAKLVWKHVIPGAAQPKDHCTGMMESYHQDPDDEDTVHIAFRGRSHGSSNYSITYLEKEYPTFCRFYFEGEEADGTLVDGIFSFRISVMDRDSSFIIANEERSGLSLGALLERWCDDAMGFQHDRLLVKLDELYGSNEDTSAPKDQLA
jgi:hypothetical protein